MSENSEPIRDEQIDAGLSHRRILILMGAAIAAGACLSVIFISWRFGLGFLIGGLLSVVNYLWLKRSLGEIFEKVIRDGRKPRFMTGSYLLRYVAFAVVLAIIYLTNILPFAAVLLGLASLAFAVMLEGFIRIFSIVFNQKEI